MENFFLQRSYLISKISQLPFKDAVLYYCNNFPYLKDVCFVFVCDDGSMSLPEFNKQENIYVNNFFTKPSMDFINHASFLSLLTNKQVLMPVEYVVSFDTQILSYLYRRKKGQTKELPLGIEEIIKLTKNNKCEIDCYAYMLENTLFNPQFIQNSLYQENIKIFESYFYEDPKYSTKQILNMQQKIQDYGYNTFLKRTYKQIYLYLLVMVDLNLNHGSLDADTRELKFLEYCHETIHIVSDREANLAKLYFMYGRNIKFFGKIQKNRSDIAKNLKNMAWDIFHIHNTMNNINFSTVLPESVVIPYFITFDNRLKEILDLYKFDAYAHVENTTEMHYNYHTNLLNENNRQKFFSPEYFFARNQLRPDDETLLNLIETEISIYEKKLEPKDKN